MIQIHAKVWVVLAPEFWECEENEIKCRTIIDLIQRRWLFLFYIRIACSLHAVFYAVIEKLSTINKCISDNFYFESIRYFLQHA